MSENKMLEGVSYITSVIAAAAAVMHSFLITSHSKKLDSHEERIKKLEASKASNEKSR